MVTNWGEGKRGYVRRPTRSRDDVIRPLRAYIFNLPCEGYIVNFNTQYKPLFQDPPESEKTH